MHELSIALSVIDAVIEARDEAREGEDGGPEVCAVHLRLGPLSGVDRGALEFAFQIARDGTPLQNAELLIEEMALRLHCHRCGVDRTAESFNALECPACSTASTEIVSGNELEVVAVEFAA